jgi:hypothetical protein
MGAITWRKTGVYVLVVLPVLGLAGIAVIAQQQQDSLAQQQSDPLADAARKAREQKKQEAKPKKVFTNEDLGSGGDARSRGNSATTPSGTTPNTSPAGETKDNPKAQAGGASSDAAAPPDKNDEASWRRKFREARANLADAERELDILQREAQKAQVQYYADPQKALTEQYNRKDINEKDTKIAAKKQEVEQLKQHISDLEDELRKSGGDIGWSRE